WTGIGAGGVDKGHGHDLPTQLREGESLAVLGHQAQLRRWPNPRQAVTLSGSVTQNGQQPATRRQDNEHAYTPCGPYVHVHSLLSWSLLLPLPDLIITHNFRELRERPKGQVVDNKKGAADNKL